MTEALLTSITSADVAAPLGAALLALNNAHATELSWLDVDGLAQLVAQAHVAWRIGEADALLIALDQNAVYDNPNFQWFRARYPRFVYVDRIVVAPSARGCGLARQLYGTLIKKAGAAGHQRIVCEVNLEPPNPHSDRFHAGLGFAEVGSASIHRGTKTVRYLARELPCELP
ncbi:putative Acetyltransferase, GNAT family [Bradyrhizobium sp. STM 3843]|uniref:GNAT family N-acetyltransferase n=1 Tax=Bradyrhizobium sp. STM 3843 TaxID=551947 RepID=UPI00024030A0|nr:GNAT family N-acetyltransferase [Bradyrhizobium sp. STM 3843]CCE09456.1 putative Acetyltransferase, GNAT family [Bradyrhizobium sp. STM 3843]